ncbi:hypothetical protein RDWZM_008043 [Blomia tropicalis]|uniref:[histone H3]-lysine(36) N-trimethyltransferase n=1 Tax=Blomia tropicalis TaxID=40697 RepID=A0A9Q0M0R7_BLOTA|nr:hypothetical protein RDWZM_008043 [Blomia tropicalis]
MTKRTFLETSSEEGDVSEISKPTTKIIRVDDNPNSSFSDKCIQVDTDISHDGVSTNIETISCTHIIDNHDDGQVEIEKNLEDKEIILSYSNESTQTNNSNEVVEEDILNNQRLESIASASTTNDGNDQITVLQVTTINNNDQCSSDIINSGPNSSSYIDCVSSTDCNPSHHLTSSSSTEDDSKTDIYLSDGSNSSNSNSTIVCSEELFFNGVTVYYFRRSQGFTCIPSQGGSTLGMENTHTFSREFTLESHAEERKRNHREILLRHRRFAKMNKNSSTSESEDDSCDDLSDLSDVDLENDSCYFLQPVPIRERRALLRASGVRKIETTEKEECRDIRISREYCGCDCQVYCNPELCSCHLAGIKCQVDRMSFPCGCSRGGCSNKNGRIEFNPHRVRTHFIHTIMRIEMEKYQNQPESSGVQNVTAVSNNSNTSQQHTTTTDNYCASTSNYVNSPMASQCNQSMQSSQDMYMSMQNNQVGYTLESQHLMMPGSNNYADQSCVNNEYSPDNSSYSENSDYTSDDFDDEVQTEKISDQNEQGELYVSGVQHQSNYGQEMVHVLPSSMSQTNPIGSNQILPPFPSINSNCDLSTTSANYKSNSHCNPVIAYQNYLASIECENMTQQQQQQQQQQTHQTSVYSYDIHGTVHYNNYGNEFHKKDNNFSNMADTNVHMAVMESNSSNSNNDTVGNSAQLGINTNDNGNNDNVTQQYIDLSLSIASSSSAESLLSAAITSDEDSRLTPVSFTHIHPLTSTSSFYAMNDNSSSQLCPNTFDPNTYTHDAGNMVGDCGQVDTSCEPTTETSKSLSSNDNFGEIIKKTIVESVSAVNKTNEHLHTTNSSSTLTNGDSTHMVNHISDAIEKMVVIQESNLISTTAISGLNGASDSDHNHVLTNGDCVKNIISPSTAGNIHHSPVNEHPCLYVASNVEFKLNNTKTVGKFRFMGQLTSTNNEAEPSSSNTELAYTSPSLQLNHPTISDASNCDSTLDCSSNIIQSKNDPPIEKKERKGKHKNGEAQIVETDENQQKQSSPRSPTTSRRRSTRLKKLEEKKESASKYSNNLNIDNSDQSQSNLGISENNNDMQSSMLSTNLTNGHFNSINDTNRRDSTTPSKVKDSGKKSKSKHKSKHSSKKKESKRKRAKSSKLLSTLTNKENNDSNSSRKASTSLFETESQNDNFSTPALQSDNNTQPKSINESPQKLSSDDSLTRPENLKSRWRRNFELDNGSTIAPSETSSEIKFRFENGQSIEEETNESPPYYETIEENIYLFERKKSKSKKETKKMVCDCILLREDRARGVMGCGDDCLNRMLMIECGWRCFLAEHCSNQRFQKKQYAKVEQFKTLKKGWGLRACEDIPPDTFIMEYVGEVIDPFDFHKRVEKYAKQKLEHHYFMALKADEIIDATCKGNVTRFVNHSCEPNSRTQKWTVNGELRIGFFTLKHVSAGEEITFDYQFQRYGKKAQKCYCGSQNCRGVIGGENANILTDGSKIPRKGSREEVESESNSESEFDNIQDVRLEEEIHALADNGGLRNRQNIILAARLMLRAEECQARLSLISIIMKTVEMAYLRLFLDYHGLQIIWSWMVEAEDIELKANLLKLLEILPIPNKNMLINSKVLKIVERWAQKDSPEWQQFFNFEEKLPVENEKSEIENNKLEDTSSEKLDDQSTSLEKSENVDKNAPENDTSPTKNALNYSNLSSKIVIKRKSKLNPDEQQTMPKKTNMSIGFLAQKLLIHWKDLKEEFKIPRVDRQTRHNDEREADLKSEENENRRAQCSSIVSDKRTDEEKRIDVDKEFTIGGLLGNKNRFQKRSTDTNRDNVRPQFFINSNISNQSSINKLSKEEHRKMFEIKLANVEYFESLKMYQKNIEAYEANCHNQLQMIQQLQLQALQQNDSTFKPTVNDMFSSSVELTNLYNEQLIPFTNNVNINQTGSCHYLSTPTTSQYQENTNVVTLKDIVPTFNNPLILLSSTESTHSETNISPYAIDNVDYSQVRYDSDDFIESMEKKMFDEIYPPPGIFYITKEGQTYFISLPNELSPTINIKENVTEPLPLSFTRKRPANDLPYNWDCSQLKGHTYYFNKNKHIKQWHPPPENQTFTYDDDQRIDLLDIGHELNYTSNSNSPHRIKKRDTERGFDSDLLNGETFGSKRKNLRKIQERFRNDVSQFVVKCLNPFMRPDCRKGRISNSEDFKYLARKLTHNVVAKEMKQCKNTGDLACNKAVKQKTHEYVKKYMYKFGSVYRTESFD